MTSTVRVITTCTSRKVANPGRADRASLPGLGMVPDAPIPAERLYAGEQHRRLMAGVDELRNYRPVEVWVISAKAGFLAGERPTATYDDSFTRLGPGELRRRADDLGIAETLRAVARQPRQLTVILAGNEYFDAARLDEPVEWSGATLALVSPRSASRMPADEFLRVVPVGQAEAKRWSLPLTLLKGEIARRLFSAIALGSDPESIMEPGLDLLTRLAAPRPQILVG